MKKRKFKVGDRVNIKNDLKDIGITFLPDVQGLVNETKTIKKFIHYQGGFNWYNVFEDPAQFDIREDKLIKVSAEERPAKFKTYKIEIIVSTDEKIDRDILNGCWLNDEDFSGAYKIKIKKIKMTDKAYAKWPN